MTTIRNQNHNFGEITGTCAVCGINLWSAKDNKPVIFPCNIYDCPYEDPEQQKPSKGFEKFSTTGSGLGQIDF